MKKLLIILLAVFFLLPVLAYIFIPKHLNILCTDFAVSNQQSAYRVVADEERWAKWFPGKRINNSAFSYNKDTYEIEQKFFEGVAVRIRSSSSSWDGVLRVFSLSPDSVVLRWESMAEASSNPFKKIQLYFDSKKVKDDVTGILSNLKLFLQNQQDVYGITIRQETVKDTLLAMTKISLKEYPSTDTIYSLIEQLRKYIAAKGLKETNAPMLNVSKNDSGHFETRVAIPTDKGIKSSEDIAFKLMIPGKILVTEIKGGPLTVEQAFNELGNYVSDHKLESPAIPFQSLVTDRRKEQDTSKWVTKIYYPIL